MSKKKQDDMLKKALSNENNTYEDKLAILKFITRKNSGTISSAFSSILKKKN